MKKICFRVDANNCIGQGHAMRCLTIAKELKKRSMECIFVVSDKESALFFENNEFEYLLLQIEYKDYSVPAAKMLVQILKKYGIEIVVIDSYDMTEQYIKCVREVAKAVCFHCKDEVISADLLINYNVNYNTLFYEKCYTKKNVRLLLGTTYVPLREEFVTTEAVAIQKTVRKILFLTGGGDSKNIAGCFLKQLKKDTRFHQVEIVIVAGRYSPYYRKALDVENEIPMNVKLIRATDKIVNIMKNSDLVVSAGGTTMYELCALGVPAVIYTMAENQRSEAVNMGNNGYVCYAGDISNKNFWNDIFEKISRLINSQEERKRMSEKMRKLIDGKGSSRIASEILNL